jgi:hypothetical protein
MEVCMRKNIFGLLIAALSFLAIAGTAAAGGQEVPFHVTYSGAGGFSSPSSVFFIGSGVASHLGLVTTNGGATDFTPATACPAGGIDNHHFETFTAANGDTLSLLSNDTACWDSPTLLRCTVCEWTVTGGTGRFADAKGKGSLQGWVDLAAGTFAGEITGTISY